MTVNLNNGKHLWQSQVEIKDYSAVYFNHVAAFKALWRRTFVKGGADMHCMDAQIPDTLYTPHMSPAKKQQN